MDEEKEMKKHAGLVYNQARKYKNFHDFDDLVSVGNIGLLNAIRKFDASKGYAFSTYAVSLIHFEIIDYMNLLSENRPHIPKRTLVHSKQVKKQGLENSSASEVSAILGITEVLAEQAIKAANMRTITLDMKNNSDEEERTFSRSLFYNEDFSGSEISDFLETLSEKERFIISGVALGLKGKVIEKHLKTYRQNVVNIKCGIKEKYNAFYGINAEGEKDGF